LASWMVWVGGGLGGRLVRLGEGGVVGSLDRRRKSMRMHKNLEIGVRKGTCPRSIGKHEGN
jgi:hypothetical protein